MNQRYIPKISIELNFNGGDVDLGLITEELGINPTKARTKEDWPQVSIDMGLAHDSWSFSSGNKESLSVSCVFEEFISTFSGKEEIINKLMSKYALESILIILIKAEGDEKPELILNKNCIKFASKIGAEIHLDLYY